MLARCLLVLLGLGGAATAVADDDLDSAFGRDVMIVVANAHACHRFDIYLAVTRPQQRRGLMHVRELPRRTGMLFVYGREQRLAMWMKNTFLSLDIAFAHSDGRIANIARSTEPQSLETIPAVAPVQYVLELNAGVADELSIDAGSQMLWGPIFEADVRQ